MVGAEGRRRRPSTPTKAHRPEIGRWIAHGAEHRVPPFFPLPVNTDDSLARPYSAEQASRRNRAAPLARLTLLARPSILPPAPHRNAADDTNPQSIPLPLPPPFLVLTPIPPPPIPPRGTTPLCPPHRKSPRLNPTHNQKSYAPL